MSVRRARGRALALVLAASAVVAGVASSHASTADRLDHARARLRSLGTEIAMQSRAVEDARAAAIAADARAVEADQALVPLTVQRILVAQRVADVQAQLAAAQQRFHDAVVQALVAAAQDVRTRRDAALAEQQAALVRQQQAMGALNEARTEIVSLIDRLRAK